MHSIPSHWPDYFSVHYLYNHLARGGSKVKVITGQPTEISQIFADLTQRAHSAGYSTVQLSARQTGRRLNDLPNLYRLLARQLDLTQMVKGLCTRIANELGYAAQYDGGPLLPLLMQEGLQRNEAIREIRQATGALVQGLDTTVSFSSFVYTLMREHLIAEHPEGLQLALKWFRGEKLERSEKQAIGLYESLSRSNARCWLNSLLQILVASGQKGLILMIAELEVMTERSPATQRFLYTPAAVKDSCELFRQLIDDAELMSHFMLLLGGTPAILHDEKRGFKSYEALWMRLQTGLMPGQQVNLLADLLPAPALLAQEVSA